MLTAAADTRKRRRSKPGAALGRGGPARGAPRARSAASRAEDGGRYPPVPSISWRTLSTPTTPNGDDADHAPRPGGGTRGVRRARRRRSGEQDDDADLQRRACRRSRTADGPLLDGQRGGVDTRSPTAATGHSRRANAATSAPATPSDVTTEREPERPRRRSSPRLGRRRPRRRRALSSGATAERSWSPAASLSVVGAVTAPVDADVQPSARSSRRRARAHRGCGRRSRCRCGSTGGQYLRRAERGHRVGGQLAAVGAVPVVGR